MVLFNFRKNIGGGCDMVTYGDHILEIVNEEVYSRQDYLRHLFL